jgi:thiamine-phosphate pyrophosphorylase
MSSGPIDFRLYLITDRKLFSDHTAFLKGVEQALKAGVRAIQLREKDISVRELLRLAYLLKELTAKYNAKLFINDRTDIALAVGAEGVHVGGAGLPASAVRKAGGAGILIGVSTHGYDEAVKAEADGADFITFGPVFETPSKMHYGKPLGVDQLGEVGRKLSIPIFALGGIKKENAQQVLKSGSYGIALISGILAATDIKANTEEFMRLLK